MCIRDRCIPIIQLIGECTISDDNVPALHWVGADERRGFKLGAVRQKDGLVGNLDIGIL